jgi:oxygen-dependent protoporphyrinogen oxidase
VRGYAVKAVTFVDQKWPRWGRPDHTVLRLSLGRHGEEALLQRTDAALVELAIAEASELLGVRLPAPVDAAVHRWGGALPQYPPGHRDRMAAARAALPASLALAGAAYDGVGIAACVHSGHAAADQLLEQLGA